MSSITTDILLGTHTDLTIIGCSNSMAKNFALVNDINFIDIDELKKNFQYSDLTESTIEITQYTGKDKDVFIPEVIDGKKVTRIGDSAFKDCSEVVSVRLPSSVTSIGFDAFQNCTSLTEINLSDSIREIEGWAFENCTSLKNITLPKSVSSIGSYTFYGCSALTNIILGDWVERINSGAFYGCSNLSYIDTSSTITYIGTNAFKDCPNVTIYGYANTAAERYASDNGILFFDKDKIKNEYEYYTYYDGGASPWNAVDNSIIITNYKGSDSNLVIPELIDGLPVTSIAGEAFYSNENLKSVTVPNSVSYINGEAFSYCTKLTDISLPDSLTYLGSEAFEGCSALKSISLPDSVTTISNGAFSRCTSLKNVELSDSLTSIGYNAFDNCTSLESITIPDSVTSLGGSAFSYCSKLSSISIPNSVKSIGENAFYQTPWFESQKDTFVLAGNNILIKYNGADKSVTIPNGVTSISGRVFAYNMSMTSAVIPNTVRNIGYSAFEGCYNLKKITIPDSVTEIELDAFTNCKSLEEIKIPDSIKQISWGTFSGCTSLTEVTIPDSVKYIEELAFNECDNLETAIIPKSVEYIGWRAFPNDTNLTIYGHSDSEAENYANDNEIAFVDISDTYFLNTSSVSSTELYLGDTLTITGEVQGSPGSYTYAYYYKQSKNAQWRAIGKEFGTATKATLKPTAATSYDIMVKVKSGNDVHSKTFTVNVSPAFLNNSEISAADIYKGSTVELTAASTGGVGETKYAFYYKKNSDSDWTALTTDKYDDYENYVYDTTVSFKPTATGTYDIKISAKDSNDRTADKTFTLNVHSNLINKSTVNTKQLNKGDTLVITGSASGGKEGYTYAYYYKQSTASVWRSIGTEFGTATQATLKPSVLTNYDIIVRVKDSAGKIAEKKFTVKVVVPELENTSSISSTQLYNGDTLTITGAADGGTGSYKYAYYYKQSKNLQWRAIGTEFGTAATATFKPTTATDYDILVKVQDSSNTVSEKKFKFNVAPTLVNKSTVSTTQLYKGETLTLTGAASGGLGEYKYAFYYKQSSTTGWRVIGDLYGSATSASIKLSNLTDYDIMIRVKDKNGRIAETHYTVNIAPVLVNNSKVSTTQLSKGNTLTLTGAASGGLGEYKYAFYYKQSSTTGWRVIGDLYGSATSASIKLSNVTDYDIMIRVKDKNGKMAEKTFVVTVK